MRATGIIRKVDDLGRVVLPVEIRRALDIEEHDQLEIFVERDQIVLQKFTPSCIFCESTTGLVTYLGKNICQNCIRKLMRP